MSNRGVLCHVAFQPRKDGLNVRGHIGFLRVMRSVPSATAPNGATSVALSANYSLFERQDGTYGVLPSNPLRGWKEKQASVDQARQAQVSQLQAMLISLKDEKPELCAALENGLSKLTAPTLLPFGFADLEKVIDHDLYENAPLAYEGIDQLKEMGKLTPGTVPEKVMVKSIELKAMRAAASARVQAVQQLDVERVAVTEQDDDLPR